MAVPALLYLAVTGFDPALVRGWAIPSATDIAFAIAVLALLGDRANPTLKLLLVTIAIVDDVGAVIIIALAYTADLDGMAIAAAVAHARRDGRDEPVRRAAAVALPHRFRIAVGRDDGERNSSRPLSGVLAAFAIPLGRGEPESPLKRLEHAIHPWVMFGVVPLFGFASAGRRDRRP